MSKDRKRKKFLQGMEHLRSELPSTQTSPLNTGAGIVASEIPAEHTHVKKDLWLVLVLTSIIILVLVGMFILDKKTDIIAQIAINLSSIFNI